MDSESGRSDTPTLRDYVRVLQRRKWIVLVVAAQVLVAAVLFSLQQEPVYAASAEVLVSRENVAAGLVASVEGQDRDPDRLVETQARLASVPAVAERALKAAGVTDRTPDELLENSTVKPKGKADLLEFKVEDRDPGVAARLATEYAREFTRYRRELDTAALERAREGLEARIRAVERSGRETSALYDDLVSKQQQLQTLEALQGGKVLLVRPAGKAEQVEPEPLQNAVLGLGLGLIFGTVLAFLWEGLDTRVRSVDQVRDQLGLPLLASVPATPRRRRREERLPMLTEPEGRDAEAYRVLRTRLGLTEPAGGARVVMVTSAVREEGKSTTLANVAVALARAGRRVIAVDADLRRPTLHQVFNVDAEPGLSDVLFGHVELPDALATVSIPKAEERDADGNGNGRGHVLGVLQVLPAGARVRQPAELIAYDLVNVLEELKREADVILVDAPAFLLASESMALAAAVDGLIVVTRLGFVRKSALEELRRSLEIGRTTKLGFVATAADVTETYRYGYDGRPALDERLFHPSRPEGKTG